MVLHDPVGVGHILVRHLRVRPDLVRGSAVHGVEYDGVGSSRSAITCCVCAVIAKRMPLALPNLSASADTVRTSSPSFTVVHRSW